MIYFLPILLIALLAVAVYFDVRIRRIPNLLTLGGVFLGLISNGLTGGWKGIEQSGWGLLVVAVIGFCFWSAHLIGGGDHKLLMAVGAFVGYPQIMTSMAAVALVGGLQALLWAAFAKARVPDRSMRELLRTTHLPYSVAIAIGSVAGIFVQPLIFRG